VCGGLQQYASQCYLQVQYELLLYKPVITVMQTAQKCDVTPRQNVLRKKLKLHVIMEVIIGQMVTNRDVVQVTNNET